MNGIGSMPKAMPPMMLNAGPTPRAHGANESMRALAAMQEPDTESTAHEAFEGARREEEREEIKAMDTLASKAEARDEVNDPPRVDALAQATTV